jgi:HNH endonuclease/AP2 domain
MITQDRLKQLVVYDPETGIFTWAKSRVGCKLGKRCGRTNSRGYVEICVDYKLVGAHQLAFVYMTGECPAEIDHKNRIQSDNRWGNLRACDRSQNMGNSFKSSNTSGIKGVVWDSDRSKWRAQIRINGKKVNLGRFDKIDDAQYAHNFAAQLAFGEFAACS